MPETNSQISQLELLLRYSKGSFIRIITDTPPQTAKALKKHLEKQGFTVDLKALLPTGFEVNPQVDVTLFVEEEHIDSDALKLVGGFLDAAREYLVETDKSQVFVSKPDTDNQLLTLAPNVMSRSQSFVI